jgi:hypothetical protein
MEELASRCYFSPYDWAVLHTGLGQHDEAMERLRQALQERSPRVIWLNVDPTFDSLRRDRRFDAMVRVLGCNNRWPHHCVKILLSG